MVGIYLAVFIKRKLCDKIKQKSFQICKVKTGAYGATGNKGAVCIRFTIADQNFMAINCHLVSGRRREEQRNDQIAKIFEHAFEKNLRSRGMTVDNHEQVILMGDLNFRINAFTRQEAMEKIKQGRFTELIREDDLSLAFEKFNANNS
jgi:endonuclease/exonuclease/phosphatase family metal-dependent hydrolase